MKNRKPLNSGSRCALVGLTALAGCAGAAEDAVNVDIHGFVSQGYLKTNRNNYLGDSQRGSAEFNEAGINASSNVTSDLRIGLQLFSRDLGQLGNDNVVLDWAYADYRYRDWLGLRAGRIKQPLGFYNESRDIELARTSVLLPQAVYFESYRDVVSAFNGGSVYGHVRLDAGGSADYQLFGGSENLGTDSSIAQSINDSGFVTLTRVDMKYVYGTSLIWNTPAPGLRVGGTFTRFAFDFYGDTVAIPPGPPGTVVLSCPAFSVYVASAEYTWRNLVLSAEYLRMDGEVDSSSPLVPSTQVGWEGWYGRAEYRVNPWLELGTYYSDFNQSWSNRHNHDPDTYQRDLAFTTRFDINDHWLIKLEGHWIRGYSQVLKQENLQAGGFLGTKRAETDWLLFAAKTTLNF